LLKNIIFLIKVLTNYLFGVKVVYEFTKNFRIEVFLTAKKWLWSEASFGCFCWFFS